MNPQLLDAFKLAPRSVATWFNRTCRKTPDGITSLSFLYQKFQDHYKIGRYEFEQVMQKICDSKIDNITGEVNFHCCMNDRGTEPTVQLDCAPMQQLRAQNNEMKVKLRNLEERQVRRRRHHKFQSGACFYIVSDTWRPSKHLFKFGITTNINQRLATYRTSMPATKIHLLFYTKKHRFVEDWFKQRNWQHLVSESHEYVEGLSLSEIELQLKEVIKIFHIEGHRSDELTIQKYNIKLLK